MQNGFNIRIGKKLQFELFHPDGIDSLALHIGCLDQLGRQLASDYACLGHLELLGHTCQICVVLVSGGRHVCRARRVLVCLAEATETLDQAG